ncbi:mechanosensitive ion channel family protein [Frigidibacter oleivorans]|uniref:mechanosensitive ion channel family protein n=1 Tax=Frigidibacter oleivorans TaxID=2487129 RepID=UPI000F8D0D69|nr:mechanosensitive ion channel family protein [Frigidibacter oleivorans]
MQTELTELRLFVDRATGWLPDWLAAIIVFTVAGAAGFLLWRTIFEILTRAVSGRDLFWRSLVQRGARPARFAFVIVALILATSLVAPLNDGARLAWQRFLTIGLIVCIALGAQTALYIWTTIHLRRFKLDAEDNLLARKHVTQSRILMRVANVVIVVLGLSAALMTFDSVRQFGVSLLAAGGAAGVVVGLALQPVLKNLFAGIQLAITQPIRIDDAVIVEGEWGNVEEITSTYVVVKVWDWRRLIVPLVYFIEQPFQNWTRENAALIGTVMLYLDHSAPVDRIRARGEEIAKASPLWDGKVYNLAVTDFRERVMEVRVLVSARNAPRVFDLRCEMREKLIGWVQAELPGALPRTREEISSTDSRLLAMPAVSGPAMADPGPRS